MARGVTSALEETQKVARCPSKFQKNRSLAVIPVLGIKTRKIASPFVTWTNDAILPSTSHQETNARSVHYPRPQWRIPTHLHAPPYTVPLKMGIVDCDPNNSPMLFDPAPLTLPPSGHGRARTNEARFAQSSARGVLAQRKRWTQRFESHTKWECWNVQGV